MAEIEEKGDLQGIKGFRDSEGKEIQKEEEDEEGGEREREREEEEKPANPYGACP